MASDAVLNSKQYTNTDEWVVDIYKNLHQEDLQDNNSHGGVVSVCKVPASLKSPKQEAFVPQFVGLGPYHHRQPKLFMTEKLKLDAAKRALCKHLSHIDSEDKLSERIKNFISGSDIEAFYHVDVCSTYNNHTLSYILTVDGLFLLGLLHTSAATTTTATTTPEQRHSYFLTGRHGMAPVNADGVELTMDFIIRDVFMLENQIPTHFLKQIWSEVVIGGKSTSMEINQIQSNGEDQVLIHEEDDHLSSTMLKFCEALCPFVHFEKLSKDDAEGRAHLLDLMYHLIVPEYKPAEPKGLEPEPNKEAVSVSPAKPDQKSPPESGDDVTVNRNGCCFKCFSMCFNILFLLLAGFFIIGFILYHIVQLVLWVLSGFLRLINPAVEALYNCLQGNESDYKMLKPYREMVGRIKKASDKVNRPDTSAADYNDDRPVETIPSVSELHNAGIHFQPVPQGGISSIEFDEIKCQFQLPAIKLNVNSEAIMRNLVAYETLTKSKGLVFTRYIEIMRAIIDTPEDVKILVQGKIIQSTELSDEDVPRLFNGMEKSVRPTKTPKLEKVIGKVNAKFESSQRVKRALVRYVNSSGKLFAVVAALVFLVLTAVQTYCSVFGCSASSRVNGDYARNNLLLSSV